MDDTRSLDRTSSTVTVGPSRCRTGCTCTTTASPWIRREVEKDDGFAAELVQVAIEFGNQGTLRRIGGLLERVGVQANLLRRLERELRQTSTFIPWIPNRKKRGKTSKRWGIVFNDE